jgi:hypothetical protein
LFERLAAFRPSIDLIATLDQIHADDDGSELDPKFNYDTLASEIGMVDDDFFAKHAFVEFMPADGQLWLDLRLPEVIEQLRRRLAPWLSDQGFVEFDFSDLVRRERQVTQYIASLAIDAGANGIIYLSRLHPGHPCWAIFEGTSLRQSAIVIPLTPHDLDFERVQEAYHLRLPSNFRAPGNVNAHHMSTGGVVQGAEGSAISQLRAMRH